MKKILYVLIISLFLNVLAGENVEKTKPKKSLKAYCNKIFKKFEKPKKEQNEPTQEEFLHDGKDVIQKIK